MSSYIQPQISTFKADADLADYSFVKLGSKDENVAQAGAGEKAIGVNMSKGVKSGECAEISHGDGALIKLAGAVTRGDSIASDAAGLGVVGTTGQFCPAVAMQSGVAGDVISIKIDRHYLP